MKQKLLITTVGLAAIAVLILFFPFRIGTLAHPNYGPSSANMGPSFILSDPTKVEISNAVHDRQSTSTRYSRNLYQSNIDYPRTFILMLPFVAGAVASFIWMRNLEK